MSQPLTADRFEQFVEAYTQNHSTIITRLDKIDATLEDHTSRLDRIEQLLWHGERLTELERRVLRLGELSGDAELAAPLVPPLGFHRTPQSP